MNERRTTNDERQWTTRNEYFEKDKKENEQRRQIGDIRPESVKRDTREYLTGGDDIALLMLEGLGDDEPLIMKGEKGDYITMDQIYDLFIDTGYYMNLKDKLKYTKRNLTSTFKSMAQFCDNMKDKINRRINGRREYIRGGGVLEGYKAYVSNEDTKETENKRDTKEEEEYKKVEYEEDSDEEPIKSESNIKQTIKREATGCLFSE